MNLHNVIKENIKYYIYESLRTQKQKYGQSLVDRLKDLDPTKTYKYIDFICKLYKNGISKDKIKSQIDDYNTRLNKNLIPKEYRDINKIKNYDELINILNNEQREISNTEIKKQYGDLNSPLVKKQYWKTITTDKGSWQIYIPTTMEQSIQIASKDTTWCTQMENKNKNYFYIYRYNPDICFYYFVNMNGKTTKLYNWKNEVINDHQILMYQIQVYPDNKQYEIFNNNDEKMTIDELYEETGIKQNDYKWKPMQDGHYDFKINNIRYIFNIKNGKFNGNYKEYYENGGIRIEINYKNNKLDGKYIEYNKDGNIEDCSIYKNDEFVKYCDEV